MTLRKHAYFRGFAALALLACGLAGWAPAARADTEVCTAIDTAPMSIVASGHYCLTHDITMAATDSYAIRIIADDVVLDCNGHTLHPHAAVNTDTGIYSPNGFHGGVVRNCTVDGFEVGLLLSGSTEPGAKGFLVEDNLFLRSRTTAIYVIGSDNVVQGNRVSQTTAANNGVNYGIFLYSPSAQGVGNIIRDNLIADIKPTPPGGGSPQETLGIVFFNVTGTQITGNVITGLYAPTGASVTAIRGSQTSGNLVEDNQILSGPSLPAPYDGANFGGIVLQGTTEQQATNVCRDNVVGTFSADVNGCVQDGNQQF